MPKSLSLYRDLVICVALLLLMGGATASGQATKYTISDSPKIKKTLRDIYLDLTMDPHVVFKTAQEQLAISKELNYVHGIAESNRVMGVALFKMDSVNAALAQFATTLAYSRENGDKHVEGLVHIDIGNQYIVLGIWDKSFQNYTAALDVFKSLNDKGNITKSYEDVANVMTAQNLLDEANKYYFGALAIAEETKDTSEIVGITCSIGANYVQLKQYTKALPFLQRSLSLRPTAYGLGNMGYYYDDKGNNDSALYFFNKSMDLYRQVGDNLAIADLTEDIGRSYYKMGKKDSAEKMFKAAIEIAKLVQNLKIISDCETNLSEIYAEKGDYKNAYMHQASAQKYADSLKHAENERKFAEMNATFNVKETDAKNQALTKENELQKLKLQQKNLLIYAGFGGLVLLLVMGVLLMRQSKLKADQQKMELEQKQLLAQMNPHFIFNCLNSIQQFVVQNDTENANRYLADFALLMRQTLDNSKDGVITLRREIDYLENYLSFERMRFEDKFHYAIICAENVNIDMVEIPSMIIQPFVENAIRHGLFNLTERIGQLKISFSLAGDQLVCEVDDNGIGREESKKIKEQRLIKYQSHGMDLTRQRLALVSKMTSGDYTISIIDKKDANQQPLGTTIIIKFPLRA